MARVYLSRTEGDSGFGSPTQDATSKFSRYKSISTARDGSWLRLLRDTASRWTILFALVIFFIISTWSFHHVWDETSKQVCFSACIFCLSLSAEESFSALGFLPLDCPLGFVS